VFSWGPYAADAWGLFIDAIQAFFAIVLAGLPYRI